MIVPPDPRITALEAMAVPLGTLVHDVNNALSAIATTAHSARIEGPCPEDLTEILAGVEQITAVIADLRPLIGTGRASGTTRRVAAFSLLRPIDHALGWLLGRSIRVTWDLPDDAMIDSRVDDFVRSALAHLWVAADNSLADTVIARIRPTPLGWSMTVEIDGATTYGPVALAFVEA